MIWFVAQWNDKSEYDLFSPDHQISSANNYEANTYTWGSFEWWRIVWSIWWRCLLACLIRFEGCIGVFWCVLLWMMRHRLGDRWILHHPLSDPTPTSLPPRNRATVPLPPASSFSSNSPNKATPQYNSNDPPPIPPHKSPMLPYNTFSPPCTPPTICEAVAGCDGPKREVVEVRMERKVGRVEVWLAWW